MQNNQPLPTVDGSVARHAGAGGIEHGILAQQGAAKQGGHVLQCGWTGSKRLQQSATCQVRTNPAGRRRRGRLHSVVQEAGATGNAGGSNQLGSSFKR